MILFTYDGNTPFIDTIIRSKQQYILYSSVYNIFTLEKNIKNEETTKLIADLVDRTRKHLGEENCHTFPDVKWSDKGGTNEESLKEYLKEFGNVFEEKVKMLIKRVGYYFNVLYFVYPSFYWFLT